MNKRIKSLLIAGLLVFSMSGNAFANNSYTSVVENPKFEEGTNQKLFELQDGNIVLNITENEDGSYYITINWDSSKVRVISVKTYYENEYEVTSETQFKDGEDCSTIIKDGDNYKVNLSDMIKSKLVKVEVKFEPVKDDEPVTPPTDPEEPPVDPEEPPTGEEPQESVTDPEPEAGDSSLLAYVSMASVSVVGLYFLNRKKDEDK